MSLNYRFLQRTYDTLLRTEEEFERGDKFKDSRTVLQWLHLMYLLVIDVVFFARSPLSPHAYSNSLVFLEAMVDVNKVRSENST